MLIFDSKTPQRWRGAFDKNIARRRAKKTADGRYRWMNAMSQAARSRGLWRGAGIDYGADRYGCGMIRSGFDFIKIPVIPVGKL